MVLSAKTRMKKKLLQVGISLLLLVTILFILIHLSPVQKLVHKYAVNKLEQNLGLNVSIRDMDFNLISMRISLKGVTIRGKNRGDFPPFLEAENVQAKVPVSLLTRGKLELKELSASNLKLSIYIDSDSNTNIPQLSPRPEEGKDGPSDGVLPDFRLGKMTFFHGSILYVDRRRDLAVESPLMNMSLEWIGGIEHVFRIESIGSGSAAFGQYEESIQSLSAEGVLGKDYLDIQNARLEFTENEIRLSGRIDHLLSPSLHLQAAARIDLESLRPVIPKAEGLSGSMSLTTSLEGPAPELQAEAHVLGKNIGAGKLRHAGLEATLSWKEQRLSIDSFKIGVAGGSITGIGEIHPFDWGKGNRASLKWHDIDLTLLPLPNSFPTFASSVSGHADLQWNEPDWTKIATKAELRFQKPESSRLEDNSPPFLEGIMRAEAGPKQVSVVIRDLLTEGLSFSGDILLKGRRLSGQYSLHAPDLGAASSKYLPSQIKESILPDIGGNMVISGRIEGTLASPRISSTWKGSGITWLGLSGMELTGEANWQDRIIHLRNFQLMTNSAVLRFWGEYPTAPLAVDPSIDFTVEGLALETVASTYGLGWEWGGLIELEGNIRSFRPFPRIRGKGRLRNLAYDRWALDEVSLVYEIKERKVYFDGRVPSLPLDFKGNLGVDSPFPIQGSLDMKAVPFPEIFPLIPNLPPAETEGEVTAHLDFSSTFEKLDQADISGSAELQNASIKLNDPPLAASEIDLGITFENDSIVIEPSSLRVENSALEIQGSVPFSVFMPRDIPRKVQEIPGRIDLKVRQMNPFAVLSLFQPGLPPDLLGSLDGTIRFTIPSLDRKAISAVADIQTFRLQLRDAHLKLSKASHLRWQSGKIEIDGLYFEGDKYWLNLKGTLDLISGTFLSVSAEGNVDLKIFQPFFDPVSLSGTSRFDIFFQGPFTDPSFTGAAILQDGRAEISQPDLYLKGLSGEIRFSGKQIDIDGLKGSLNGGKITLTGALSHEKFAVEKAALKFSGDEINLDYPSGLRSLVNARLTAESDGTRYKLGGTISVLYAEYRETFNVESRLFQLLRSKGRKEFFLERNEFLNEMDFDLRLDTVNPAKIDNNLAKASAGASLRLTGSPYNIGLSGRIDVEPGGEVFFENNSYQIQQASLDFIDPSRIVPDVNLRGKTQVSGYVIQLMVFGTPDELSAKLISDPPLSEADVVSLLLTGRRLEYVSSSLLDVVANRALDYLKRSMIGRVERIAEQGLGLDNVRIDASLIASQDNPEARITISQYVTPELELVYSQGLRETNERTIILNYNPLKNLNLRGIKQDSDAYQVGAMHEIRFGLKKSQQMGPEYRIARKGPVIQRVEFDGLSPSSEKYITQRLKLKSGKKYDFFTLQKDLNRIKNYCLKNNFLEFKLDYQKKENNSSLNLIYDLSLGPWVRLQVSGFQISRKTLKESKKLWMAGAFSQKRKADILRLIQKKLFEKGYFQATIQIEEGTVSAGSKTVSIHIEPGYKYKKMRYRFHGRQGVPLKSLLAISKKPDALLSLFNDPGNLTREMESVYRYNGYLDAHVETPWIDFQMNKKEAVTHFNIQEGILFRISRIEFLGQSNFDCQALLSAAGMAVDQPFTPERLYEAQSGLKDFFSTRGFINARIQHQLDLNPQEGKVHLTFRIEENRKAVIEDIAIFGNKITKDATIKKALTFETGQALDRIKFTQTQKKLYGLGIFDTINIDSHPMHNKNKPDEGLPLENPHRVEILVDEMQPFFLRYGGQYNTETGVGGVAELTRRNLWGKAMDAGGSIQANQREQDARVYFRSPIFLGRRMDSSVFLFATRKEEPDFTTSRLGATLQQQLAIHNEFVISYNYTFEHLRNLSGDIPLPDLRYDIGRISLSVSRDSRKNILDSLNGSFLSLTGEYAEKYLGSDVRYVRFYGQYFLYKPLVRSVTYAAAIRLGLGEGLGQELVPSERFYAGGGTSLRGFGYHEVGPKNPVTGNPQGGNAVFTLNQELRFPLYKILRGVVFMDMGNVFPRVSDIDLLDLRETAGFGLRVNLGFALARLDWGIKLDRRNGEAPFRIHFSLGQAF